MVRESFLEEKNGKPERIGFLVQRDLIRAPCVGLGLRGSVWHLLFSAPGLHAGVTVAPTAAAQIGLLRYRLSEES